MRIVRGSRGTSFPWRARRYSRTPSFLSAENIGGTCCWVPVNFFSSARSALLPIRGAGAVLGVGRNAERYHAAVALDSAEKDIGDLGAFVDADQEQTRGKGVEGAEVADFFCAENFFDLVHDLGRGGPLGLVDQQDAALGGHGISDGG